MGVWWEPRPEGLAGWGMGLETAEKEHGENRGSQDSSQAVPRDSAGAGDPGPPWGSCVGSGEQGVFLTWGWEFRDCASTGWLPAWLGWARVPWEVTACVRVRPFSPACVCVCV